jgi:NAD-dependent SIR2 family protein deacetylase
LGLMEALNALNRKVEKKEENLYRELRAAETVVIGAGAGLSTSAGFVYTGERFRENFRDFEVKYGFHDMYSGGFYPYETLEEYWAYWSRYIYLNRYREVPKPVYTDLLQLVKDKDYFVLTTNVDHCFQRAGFDKKRLFYTQGDFGLWQCSVPCHKKTYDNEETVRRMIAKQKDMRIPGELIPLCPVCKKPMTMNLRADSTFVEDEGWHEACGRYENFLETRKGSRVLFLELGCGMNTPGIIKFSFWRLTSQWPEAVYGCINLGEAYAPQEIEGKSVCISEDIGRILSVWKRRMEDES